MSNPNLEKIVEKFLLKKGWSTYYNPKYWVHPKLITDPSRQDYTNYGMDLESALLHEIENFPPFKPSFLPRLSQDLIYDEVKDTLAYYFGEKEDV